MIAAVCFLSSFSFVALQQGVFQQRRQWSQWAASGRTRLKSSCCVVLVFRCVCLAIEVSTFSDFDVSALSGAHLMLHQDSRLRIR